MKEVTTKNDTVKLRRYEDDLNVGGIGVMILGAWDVLKVVMYLFMNLKKTLGSMKLPEEDKGVAAVIAAAVIAALLLIIFLILLIHLYIGRNASKAAKGEPYKKGYYSLAVILLVLSFLSLFGYFDQLKDLMNIDTTIASFIVDLTTVYILWIVVSSTRKIRALRALHTGE